MMMPLTQKISIVLSDVDGTLVDSKKRINQGVAKIVGVSDDLALVAKTEKAIQDEFQHCFGADSAGHLQDSNPQVSASRSYPFQIDVTHPNANKGVVVESLAEFLQIPPAEFATIGDMANDILMFRGSWPSPVRPRQGSCESRFQSSAGFDDRDYSRDARSGLLASDLDPVYT
jgi:hydroxymethylpyrimidine pyrophosphatase-like HAD family hydrolase